MDYWTDTLEFIKTPTMVPDLLLVSVGAKETIFDADVKTNKALSLDLAGWGIPADAMVLTIRLDTFSDSAPFFLNPTQASSHRPETIVLIYVRSTREENENVRVSVVWVPNEQSRISLSYLYDAFEAMATNRWRNVILPAFAAVETSLSPLVLKLMRTHLSARTVKDFGKSSSFTASTALNVLLPILCKEARLPAMPEPVRIALNNLRQLRNDVVHLGLENASVKHSDAAESVCASAFALEYLEYIKTTISPLPEDGAAESGAALP
jgi:hypothetical protein